MSSFSRKQLEAWLNTITAKGRVLDVGGSQKSLSGRVKGSLENYEVLDLEIPHEGEQADIVADIQEGIGTAQENTYDQVFCLEVAEYWYNPLGALKNIARLLKRGGTLFISFHFIYPQHNPENADYLRYTRSGVRKLLKEAGFEVDEIRPKTYANSHMVKMIFDNEGMRGVGKNSGEIHREQGWLVSASKL